jgi:hypothetical protein
MSDRHQPGTLIGIVRNPHVAPHPLFERYTMRQKHSGKNGSGEYANFEAALKTVLSVPHTELKNKINAEKRKRVKKSSASRVANG